MIVTQKELDELIEWTRSYFKESGLKKAIIGLSGGIDSAVIASLCCKALGRENVIGVVMPCESQRLDESLAVKLIHSLKLNSVDESACRSNDLYINLDEVFQTFWKNYKEEVSWEDCIPLTYNKLVPANIKARLRMTTLYAVAGHVGGLVVGTTNKTEALLGYATKYGDGGVDIEPIQDFYKGEVYELAKLLGDIPQEIIDRAPSAGLWDGQTDEDELGMSYDTIDDCIRVINKDLLLDQEICVSNIESEIMKIKDIIAANKHKDIGLPHFKRD